jgi:hypothetical protein
LKPPEKKECIFYNYLAIGVMIVLPFAPTVVTIVAKITPRSAKTVRV